MEEHKTTIYTSYNYVGIMITDETLGDLDHVARLLSEGYDHAMSLEPK